MVWGVKCFITWHFFYTLLFSKKLFIIKICLELQSCSLGAGGFRVVLVSVDGRLWRLLSLELERLNMFPNHHTIGKSDVMRAFFMGNALVCGVVTVVGEELARRLR